MKLLITLVSVLVLSLPAHAEDTKLKPAIDNSTAPVTTPSHSQKSKWKCWSVSCGTHHPHVHKSWRKTRRFCVRSKPFVDYAGSVAQVTFTVAQFIIK